MQNIVPITDQAPAKDARATPAKLLAATLLENKKLREKNEELLARSVSAEMQMALKPLEFIVGDFGSVSADPEKSNRIDMTFLSFHLEVGDEITATTINPEQAFLMGCALLQIAKTFGLEA